MIKGPQTAYFGRNTFSGAVNIIPKLPGDEWETNIGLEYSPSQEAEYKAEIGTGGPLSDSGGSAESMLVMTRTAAISTLRTANRMPCSRIRPSRPR